MTYKITALSIILSVTASAASFRISNSASSSNGANFLDGNSFGVTGTDSQLLTGGFIAIYEFGLGEVPTTASNLMSSPIAALGLNIFDATSGKINDGFFDTGFDVNFSSSSDLYVVFGDGNNTSDSSSLALVKLSGLIQTGFSPDPVTFSNYYVSNASDVIIGTASAAQSEHTVFGSPYQTQTLQLAAIPEPSGALLTGLGFLMIGARRRR